MNRQVGAEVLQDQFRDSPAAITWFVEGGQVTGQLRHPGIPAVHKIGTLPDDSPFLAMKLIWGDTRADRLAQPLADRARLVAVFLQVALAVGRLAARPFTAALTAGRAI